MKHAGCRVMGWCYIPIKGPSAGVTMLDAYIIDKIRRERESRDSVRIPLHIHVPEPTPLPDDRRPQRDDDENRGERGIAIIDFTL